jgi:hypothetical protein
VKQQETGCLHLLSCGSGLRHTHFNISSGSYKVFQERQRGHEELCSYFHLSCYGGSVKVFGQAVGQP